MSEIKKIPAVKSIIGDAKATIDAIQKFIERTSAEKNVIETEERPAESVNRILKSVASEEINNDLQKIIDRL